MQSTPPVLTAGARLGEHFEVEGLLGRGGMGAVYRVRDVRNGRPLALKRLHVRDPSRGRALISLFEREYHTLAELDHPRIIQVYDYGVDEQGPFYTMELLEGTDLRSGGRMEWRKACALLRDVGLSLAILHSRRLLHRDLSPRNVMCTADGHAKLIDFGAMVPLGAPRSVVGTPPLVPPEALQLQALDARADLYSLGALGYFLLTGRHAYPARTLAQLRDHFRTKPKAPHRVVPEVPEPLSRLIMELMEFDRAARPSSASEVIQRLTSIAQLPAEDLRAISRAYLATPALVGRDAPLVQVRKLMLRSLRGRGGTLLIEGEGGSGRSRFLDACVLDAKLMGAVVLRADAGDAARGDYGVVGALCEQLLEALPERAREAARLRRPLLSQIVPALAEPEARPAAVAESERRHLQAAVRDWVRAVARQQRLALAVDDFDRIDEPSAAVLAALSHRSERRRLFVMTTAESTGEPGPAHALMREVAINILLEPLDATQTEVLVDSLFGSSSGSASLAQRIHELSEGNPRLIMELAEQSVDRGLSRYSGGAWMLADGDGSGGLPASVARTLQARLHDLPQHAQTLADALCLTDPTSHPIEDYRRLLDDETPALAHRALDTLLVHGILVPEGSVYRFANRAWGPLLAERLPRARARELHRRLSLLAEETGPPARLAQHLMASGQEERAIAVLLENRTNRSFPYSSNTLELLEHGLEACGRLGLPARTRIALELWLLAVASILSEAECFMRHAPDVLQTLERDSGLRDAHELAADPSVPAAERLTRALAQAHQRYEATPELERRLPPVTAIEELGRLCATFVGITAVTQDLEALEALPSLEPYVALSPALLVVDSLVRGMIDFNAGRGERGRAIFLEIIEHLESEELASMDAAMRREMRFGAHYVLGLIEAAMGLSSGPERVTELERQPSYRVNAWRVHACYWLMRADAAEASACQRRAELFRLQDGNRQAYPGTTMRIEARAYWLASDMVRLKEVTARIEQFAKHFPGWDVMAAVARAHYLRLSGNPEQALSVLEPVLARRAPARHLDWPMLAAAHVYVLLSLGRIQEAADCGTRYVEICAREELQPSDSDVRGVAAVALYAVGRHEEAIALADRVVTRCQEAQLHGLNLGHAYELRARLALAAGDRDAFERWAELCAREYRTRHNPTLAAKFARLWREAAHVFEGEGEGEPEPHFDATQVPSERPSTLDKTVLSRMHECIDGAERARCALTILLEETECSAGHLYGVVQGRLMLLASLGETGDCREITAYLEDFLENELAAAEREPEITATETADCGMLVIDDTEWWPLLLRSNREGELVIGGIAAVRSNGGVFHIPNAGLLSSLVTSLLEHDDIDPITQSL